MNADIRKTCDELAEQGFIAVAPDLFWRQEPGVDLSVTVRADWQHGLSPIRAYDRDAGVQGHYGYRSCRGQLPRVPQARLPSWAIASAA